MSQFMNAGMLEQEDDGSFVFTGNDSKQKFKAFDENWNKSVFIFLSVLMKLMKKVYGNVIHVVYSICVYYREITIQ